MACASDASPSEDSEGCKGKAEFIDSAELHAEERSHVYGSRSVEVLIDSCREIGSCHSLNRIK